MPGAKRGLLTYEQDLKTRANEHKKAINMKSNCVNLIMPIFNQIKKANDGLLFRSLSHSYNLEALLVLEDTDEATSMEVIAAYSALKNYFINVQKECEDSLEMIKARISELTSVTDFSKNGSSICPCTRR